MTRPALGQTLKILATSNDPVNDFYHGSIAFSIIQKIRAGGGIISHEDLENYRTKTRRPIEVNLANRMLKVCGPPPPASAGIVAAILNVMDNFPAPKFGDEEEISLSHEFFHRFIETMKFAYGARSDLGDVDFNKKSNEVIRNVTSPEWANLIGHLITSHSHNLSYYGGGFEPRPTHGTAHMSVVDAEGNAASLTSTVNF